MNEALSTLELAAQWYLSLMQDFQDHKSMTEF